MRPGPRSTGRLDRGGRTGERGHPSRGNAKLVMLDRIEQIVCPATDAKKSAEPLSCGPASCRKEGKRVMTGKPAITIANAPAMQMVADKHALLHPMGRRPDVG